MCSNDASLYHRNSCSNFLNLSRSMTFRRLRNVMKVRSLVRFDPSGWDFAFSRSSRIEVISLSLFSTLRRSGLCDDLRSFHFTMLCLRIRPQLVHYWAREARISILRIAGMVNELQSDVEGADECYVREFVVSKSHAGLKCSLQWMSDSLQTWANHRHCLMTRRLGQAFCST
jgi:hypothetical protein